MALRTKVVLLNECLASGDFGHDSISLVREFRATKAGMFRVVKITSWGQQSTLGNYFKRPSAVAAFEKACLELGARPGKYGPMPFAWHRR